jgi:hypothetical protein
MSAGQRRLVESILEQSAMEVGLSLGDGLHGISQSTWRKISERMEPSHAGKGRFHLRVAKVELTLNDGCFLSDSEVRQLLALCGGFAPLYLLDQGN